MKPPLLPPGQYSGAIAQHSTGIILNKDGRFAIGGNDVYWIFDSIESARKFAQGKVDHASNLEFSIWNYQGEHVEFIRSPQKDKLIPVTSKKWWRFW